MSDTEADLSSPGEEGFLSRWSRRKHEDRAGEVVEAPAEKEDDESLAAEQPEELPGDEDMPPVESLDEDSDYSGFMSPKVSEELRMMALRKLFSSQVFNVRDGLDDYDDDFTNFAKLGDVVTAEMRYQMERMKEAMREDGDDEALQQESGEDVLADEAEVSTGDPADIPADASSDPAMHDAVSARDEHKHPADNIDTDTYINEEPDDNRNE